MAGLAGWSHMAGAARSKGCAVICTLLGLGQGVVVKLRESPQFLSVGDRDGISVFLSLVSINVHCTFLVFWRIASVDIYAAKAYDYAANGRTDLCYAGQSVEVRCRSPSCISLVFSLIPLSREMGFDPGVFGRFDLAASGAATP